MRRSPRAGRNRIKPSQPVSRLKTNCNPQVVTAKAKAKAGDKRSALMAIKRKNQWIAQQTQARR